MHYNQPTRPTTKESIDKAIQHLEALKYWIDDEQKQTMLEQDGSETALRRKYLDEISRLNTRIKQQRGELGRLNYAQHILKQRNEQLAEQVNKARVKDAALAKRYRDVEIEAWQHVAQNYAAQNGTHPEQVRREALQKYSQIKQHIK